MKTQFYLLFFIVFVFGKTSLAQNRSFSDIEKELSQFSPKNSALTAKTIIDNLLVIEDVSPELTIEDRKPLLLIHGWSFDGDPAPPSGGYWDSFKNYLLNDSTLRANFKPYYVKYWSNEVSVKGIANELRVQVEALGFNEQKIVILAHSMGGLVARSYMTEQLFSKGSTTGLQCGKLVDRLITLGTPHHGSPMANGPARNDKLSFFLKIYINALEAAVFKEVKYNEENRSDLWWDNFDGLLNYNSYPNENNVWLSNLNQTVAFDTKTICYSGSVTGKFLIPESGNVTQEYQLGAWFTEQAFNFKNDGIVPVKSAQFEGHLVKRVRHFNEYNHADINRGKENKLELFDPINDDLNDVFPLKLTWPDKATALYLKHGKKYVIKWETPSTISQINIYLSTDNGLTYSLIEANVDAQAELYNWQIPEINANACLIKITNSDFENEQAISEQSFTIYYNQISITSPTNTDYFVSSRPDTICWDQLGLGNKVQISYHDTKNGIEKIIAQETNTAIGQNSFIWNPDHNLLPTDEASIRIKLLGLYETYGDDENYSFVSNTFQLFGEPNFTILSPENSPVDFFGIEGQPYIIGESSVINWIARGEIKYIDFYLCNSNKQIIKQLKAQNNVPAIEVTGTTNWVVPQQFGNEFYLMAQAGYSSDSITVIAYSENRFRINLKSEILNPANLANQISLQPCFEMNKMDGATQYQFILNSITPNGGQTQNYDFRSAENKYCIPKNIENELLPGNDYQLTFRAWIDTIPTYAGQVSFKTEEKAPWDFTIVAPTNGDSLEHNDINIEWNRAVGSSNYSIQLSQQNKPTLIIETLSPADTSITISIDELSYYIPINLTVTALNSYGLTNADITFMKKFRTGQQVLPTEKSSLTLHNYPNPFHERTTFEFLLTENVPKLQIILFDFKGTKIGKIEEGTYLKGKHQIVWNRRLLSGEIPAKGTYIYQLKANQYVESKMLIIK